MSIRIRLSTGRVVDIDTDDPKEAAKIGRRIVLKEQYEAEAAAQHPSQNLSGAGRFAVGAGRGFIDTIEGVKQLGNQALDLIPGVDRSQALQQQQTQQANQLEEFNKIPGAENLLSATGLGRITGGVASTPIPAAKGASVLGRLGQAAAGGAAAGGSQFVPEGGSRLQNASLGAAFGVGGQGLAEGIGAGARKIANQRAGNLAGDASEVLDIAKREGLPTLPLDDVSGGSIAQRVGQNLDRLPELGGLLGTGKARRGIQGALDDAIVRRIGDVGDTAHIFDDIKRSARAKLKVLSTKAGVKYDALARKVDPAGPVDLDDFSSMIQTKLDKQLLPQAAENALLRVGRFLNKSHSAGPFRTDDFTQARQLRTGISGLIDKTSGDSTFAHLMDVKSALERDMRKHAVANGGESLWDAADNFYKREVLSIKVPEVRKAIANQDSSKVWNLVRSAQGAGGGNHQHAQRMYKLLGPKGKRLARQGLFREAYDAAMKQGDFSPAVMQNQLQSKSRLFKQFGPADDIDGLIKLMQHTKTSIGGLKTNPPTGNRVVDWLLGASFFNAPVTTFTGVQAGKFFLWNKTARNFLLAANKATPGTAKMQRIVNKMTALANRSAILKEAQPEGVQ